MRLIEFWLNHQAEFWGALTQHLALVAAATGIAVTVGVPLGVLAQGRLAALASPVEMARSTDPEVRIFLDALPQAKAT